MAPPASRAMPARPSAMPSISPRAAAGAPRVAVSRLGSRAVGISWPVSDSKLAAPMPATPGLSQRSRGGREVPVVLGPRGSAIVSDEAELAQPAQGVLQRPHMKAPAVAEQEDPDLAAPLEAAPGRGLAEPFPQVGGRAGEPALDLVALGDQVHEPHGEGGGA